MARIRSVKPEFCTSEAIAALSRDLRLHFIQLWTYADDYGRGKDEPRVIKGAIWPIDDDVTPEQVEQWQAALARAGRIVRYTVDGRQFFEVVNWCEHQKPNRRTESRLPAPDQGIPVVAVQEQCKGSADAVQAHRDCPAVGGGVEVEGEVAGEVDVEAASVTSPQTTSNADRPDPALDDEQIEQRTNRAVGLLANLRAVGGDNPGALAAHIGKTLPDHERAELRDLIEAGADPKDAAHAVADPLRGMNPSVGRTIDPEAVRQAADAAKRREQATADRLAEQRAVQAAAPPPDLRSGLRAVPDPSSDGAVEAVR